MRVRVTESSLLRLACNLANFDLLFSFIFLNKRQIKEQIFAELIIFSIRRRDAYLQKDVVVIVLEIDSMASEVACRNFVSFEKRDDVLMHE